MSFPAANALATCFAAAVSRGVSSSAQRTCVCPAADLTRTPSSHGAGRETPGPCPVRSIGFGFDPRIDGCSLVSQSIAALAAEVVIGIGKIVQAASALHKSVAQCSYSRMFLWWSSRAHGA